MDNWVVTSNKESYTFISAKQKQKQRIVKIDNEVQTSTQATFPSEENVILLLSSSPIHGYETVMLHKSAKNHSLGVPIYNPGNKTYLFIES